MQLTNALLATAAVAGSAVAAPAPLSTTDIFTALSARSGSPVHLLPFGIQNLAVVLNVTGSTTYCPSETVPDCPSSNVTAFQAGNDRAGPYTEVPGGQSLYVAPNGALKVTVAHSTGPQDGIYTGFSYTPAAEQGEVGEFAFSGSGATGFFACQHTNSGQYTVYADITGASLPADCLGFSAITSPYAGSTPPAWQYI